MKALIILLFLLYALDSSSAQISKVEIADPVGDRWSTVSPEDFDPAFDATKLTIERLTLTTLRFTFTMAAAMPTDLPNEAMMFRLYLDLDQNVKTGQDFTMAGRNIGVDLDVDLLWHNKKWIVMPEAIAKSVTYEMKANRVSITITDPRFGRIEHFNMFAWINGPRGNMDVLPNEDYYEVTLPNAAVGSTMASSIKVFDQSAKINYSDLLRQIQADYDKSKRDPDDASSEYSYMLRLGNAPKNMQVRLAIDFSLAQHDLTVEMFGVRAITQTILQGTVIEPSIRAQVLTKLKENLGHLTGKGQETFQFAMQAAEALILLGADEGLDILLTSKEIARNYCVVDDWDTASDPAVFQQLTAKYEAVAAKSSNGHTDYDQIKAAMYKLCNARRTEGKEIVPLHPFVNLDELLPR